MKVTFKYKDGRERPMPQSHAKVLAKMGRGSYLTRDMVAAPSGAVLVIEPPAPPAEAPVVAENAMVEPAMQPAPPEAAEPVPPVAASPAEAAAEQATPRRRPGPRPRTPAAE